MSPVKAKMHQIWFRLGSAPDPAGGAYSTHPNLLAGFEGPTSKGRDGERRGSGGERKGLREEKGREVKNFKAKIYLLHPFTE